MVDPVVAAAGVQAGAQLLGGQLGSSGARKANRMQMKMDYWNYLRQKQFAQKGIRWRVEDAKAAGLHPLYALGGAGATYTPGSAQVFNTKEDLGQGLARAAQAAAPIFERELHAAQLENLKSMTQKNVTESAYWASEAARNRQESNTTKGLQTYPLEDTPFLKVKELQQFFDPMIQEGYMPVDSPEGPVLMPKGSSASESFESVGESFAALGGTLRANQEVYGKWGGLRKVWDAFTPQFGVTDAMSRLIERIVESSKSGVGAGAIGSTEYLKLPPDLRRFIHEKELERIRAFERR